MRTAWFVVLVAVTAAIQCDRSSDVPNAVANTQVVRVELSEPALSLGNHDAPVMMVEFGSFGCGVCKRFQETQLPVLWDEYIEPGRLRYRYVDIGQSRESRLRTALAHCLVRRVPRPVSLRAGFASDDDRRSLVDSLVETSDLSRRKLFRCMKRTTVADDFEDDRQAARQLDVPGTPTFVVGMRRSSGTVVGWAIAGLQPVDEIEMFIESAEKVLGASSSCACQADCGGRGGSPGSDA